MLASTRVFYSLSYSADYSTPKLLVSGSPIHTCKHTWNKTETELKQICFISADHRQHCFTSVLFERLAHVKQNAETITIGVAWNNAETNLKHFRVVSVFYFSLVSHVRASEIKLKQIRFGWVLFQFRFTCASSLCWCSRQQHRKKGQRKRRKGKVADRHSSNIWHSWG